MNPPSLGAIIPWEGFSDYYRERFFHGGIPETGFTPLSSKGVKFSYQRSEDFLKGTEAHPLLDEYWKARIIALENIKCPAFVVADWGVDLHTRGTLEAYKRISSEHKYLEVHGRKKWAYFYNGDSIKKQIAFYDRFLKDKLNDVSKWPKVLLEVRERYHFGMFIESNTYPIQETFYRKLHLGPGDKEGILVDLPVQRECQASYDSENPKSGLSFIYKFAQETAMVGEGCIRLWIRVPNHTDADIFVGLHKVDRFGNEVNFTFFSVYENGPVSLGWLRASHRAVDLQRSSPGQPWHPHDKEEPLSPTEVYALDIELTPFSVRFFEDESLRLVIKGADIVKPDALMAWKHENVRNKGLHVLHYGSQYESFVILPIVDSLLPQLGPRWGGNPPRMLSDQKPKASGD